MTVYLTHGVKKNVGDALIHSRARKLWSHVVPEAEIVSIARWEKTLPEDARLLVLCGGPGFSTRMTETAFPVLQGALQRSVPVSGFALGWAGEPKRNPGSFTMSGRTVATLRSIVEAGAPISVRDDVTQWVASQFGITAVRTGCSAWYSMQHLGTRPELSGAEPATVVYTTPALSSNAKESLAVMRMLRKRFPNSKLIASFHRGIGPDAQTTRRQSVPLRVQAVAARALGFAVRDVSYDLERIGFYQEADLHIGYRVHAHLDFVSRRTPSFLISEDGRGYGQTATLHGEGHVLWAGSPDLVQTLDRQLSAELSNGWPSLTRAVSMIEETYPVMRDAILQQAVL